eukprot:UN18319
MKANGIIDVLKLVMLRIRTQQSRLTYISVR